MKDKNQLGFGVVLSYFAVFVNLLVGLVFTPWIIRNLGQSEYGIYTLANSLISLFLFDFGLSSTTARYISNYHAKNKDEEAGRFLGLIYKFYIVVDVIIFIILAVVFFLLDKIYVTLTLEELTKLKVVYVIAAVFSVINLPFVTLNGVLTAYERFFFLKLGDLIYRIIIVFLTTLALVFNLGLYAIISIQVFSGLVLIVYKIIIVKKKTNIKIDFNYTDKNLAKEILLFSGWTMITTIFQRLIFNITPTILAITASASAIAVFGLVTTIESNAYTITTAINGMFMPSISKSYALEKDINDTILPLMIKVGKFQFAINGIIIIGFMLVGKDFLYLWVGEGYFDAYVGIILVLVPGLFYNSLQVANTALIVRNKVKAQAFITVVIGIINVMLSFILSKYYGVIGACLSIFVAYMIRAILYHIVHKKVLGININKFIKECYLRIFLVFILSYCISFWILQLFEQVSWLFLIIRSIIILIIFTILFLFIGLSKKERSEFRNRLKK